MRLQIEEPKVVSMSCLLIIEHIVLLMAVAVPERVMLDWTEAYPNIYPV